jgi:hypothetical protein
MRLFALIVQLSVSSLFETTILPHILKEPPVPWLNTAIRETKREGNYKSFLAYFVTLRDARLLSKFLKVMSMMLKP